MMADGVFLGGNDGFVLDYLVGRACVRVLVDFDGLWRLRKVYGGWQ